MNEELIWKNLVHQVFNILRDWEIPPEAQIILLGLPENTRPRALNRYRAGEQFPDQDLFLNRAKQILDIYDAVQTIFPHNPASANFWITTSNFAFQGMAPIEVMVESPDGMQRVLNHLNGGD